jgi:probable rRNA maturation factor
LSKPRVELIASGPIKVPRPRALAALARKVLADEKVGGRINLVFCEDKVVRDLNRRYRKLDKVTDVLSFVYADSPDDPVPDPEEVYGEIFVATAQAKRQAPRWKNTFFEELRRLVVHGSLHLAGYDHIRKRDRDVMRPKEDYYLS